MTYRPWYPDSWLDADGNPLPDVHEVAPGEWPPCKPDALIDWICNFERNRQKCGYPHPLQAGEADWVPGKDNSRNIVAIRIIRTQARRASE